MMNLDPSLPYIKANGIAGKRTGNDSTNVESSVNLIEQKGGNMSKEEEQKETKQSAKCPVFVRTRREDREKDSADQDNPLKGISAKEIMKKIEREYWESRGYVEVPSSISPLLKTWKYVGK